MGGTTYEEVGLRGGGPGAEPRTAGGLLGGGADEAGPRWGVGLVSGIQLSFTGGGTGVDIVLVLMSPMRLSASLMAWYIRSISSLRWAWSTDSSIRLF